MRIPIVKEALRYGAAPLVLGITCFYCLYWVLGIFFVLIAVFVFAFFRYPDRSVGGEMGSVYAPCDGRIVDIKKEFEDAYLKDTVHKISVFMTIFNVHINYSPINGVVEFVKYTPGRFEKANILGPTETNENNFIGISNGVLKIGVRQVAGWIARRIVCDCGTGDRLSAGKRFGLIKFGSRVDIYLSQNCNLCIKLGERVKAGRTVLGKINN